MGCIVVTSSALAKWRKDNPEKYAVARNHNLTAILTDLIVELRERAPYYGPATMFVFQGMADRAEARLKGINDE